jgi:hypothetical protein
VRLKPAYKFALTDFIISSPVMRPSSLIITSLRWSSSILLLAKIAFLCASVLLPNYWFRVISLVLTKELILSLRSATVWIGDIPNSWKFGSVMQDSTHMLSITNTVLSFAETFLNCYTAGGGVGQRALAARRALIINLSWCGRGFPVKWSDIKFGESRIDQAT